jgi:GMP synthase-like glutamine amidotransferase
MILIVDMNWKKNSLSLCEFVSPIVAVAQKLDKCKVKHYREVTDEDLNGCNRVILSGTALEDTAALSNPEKFQWLKETEKSVLGICAGMETIGLVFGAHLAACLEIGMTPITTLKKNPLFFGDYKAYSLHSYCVEGSEIFEVWAQSAKCVQAIKHKNKKIYGVMYHPEVRNQEILEKFIRKSDV